MTALQRTDVPVIVRSPASRNVWKAVARADPAALPTQSPEWLDALCAAGGYRDVSRCYALPDGRRAILPLVRRRLVPGMLSSMPASWGFGGLLVEGGVTAEVIATVLDEVEAASALRVRVRPNPLHAAAWTAALDGRTRVTTRNACAHVLDLSGGFDEVWQSRFRSSVRSGVRRALRAGVTVETDSSGALLPEFHALLSTSVDRWASRQHEPRSLARYRFRRRDPVHKFESVARAMGGACRVSVARYRGQAVAAILVLMDRNAHYTRGAMDPALAGRTSANQLLHALAIEDACRAECRVYHMGESGGHRGLHQFKGAFGAVATPYPEVFVERLPITGSEVWLRGQVKRVIGFDDG